MSGAGGAAAPAPGGPREVGGDPAESEAIRRGIGAAWLNVAVGLVAAPLQTAMLVRWLSPDDAGLWLMVLGFTGYLALFDLGMGPTLTRTIALLKGRGGSGDIADAGLSSAIGRAGVGDVVATARTLYLALALVLLVVTLLAGPPILAWAAHRPFEGAEAATWTLFAIGGAITLVGAFPYAALAGEGRVELGPLARAATQVAGLVGTFVALELRRSIVGVSAAWAFQSVVFAAVGAYFYRRLAPRERWRGEARGALVLGLLGPSLQWTAMSFGAVLLLSTGSVLVSRNLGAAAVPSYAILLQLFGSLRTMSLIPMNAATPFVSRAFGAGDLAAVRAHLLRSVRHTALPLFAGATLLAGFADDLVGFWVGPTHFAGWPAVWLFAASSIVESHFLVHATTVMATGRLVFVTATLAAAVLGLATGAVLIPGLGVAGMVIAWVLAQAATMGWFAPWYSLRRFALSWRSYAGALRPLGLLVLADLATVVAVRAALVACGVSPGLPRFAMGALVLAPALLLWVWLLALDPVERWQVLALVRGGSRGRR